MMFRDSLQERLHEIEIKNPSENKNDVSFFHKISDKVYFFVRRICGSVEEYTDKLRREEEYNKHKAGRDYFNLCRDGAYNHPSKYARWARTSRIDLSKLGVSPDKG